MAFDGLKRIIRGLRSVFSTSFMRSIKEIAQNNVILNDRMLSAIDTWQSMYEGTAPWLKEGDQSLGLPAIIASEIARAVTLECEMHVTGSEMADFIEAQLDGPRRNIRLITEYACASGGIVLKPCVSETGIVTEVVNAQYFYPIAFDSNSQITAAYFIYRRWDRKKIYTRLEKHELLGTDYKITNTAYVSSMEEALGEECTLGSVEAWAEIDPEVTLKSIERPLFSYFKIPIGNTIDSRSPLGVSVYSRAVELIRDADKQYQSLLWEYEGGELAIDASEDAFKIDGSGNRLLPAGKERLFRTNDLDMAMQEKDNLFKEWAPTLRDSSYMAGLNRILIQIEDACCLARGTLSDAQVEVKTATEIKIMKQRSYATVTDIQKSLQSAIDGLVYAMYALATLYELAPDGEYQTAYVWDDSIVVDAESERLRDQQEVLQRLMLPWEYRMKWYGEDEKTARAKCEEISGGGENKIMGFLDEPV